MIGSDGSAASAIRITRSKGVLEMDGHDTFLMAVHRLACSTVEVLELAGLTLEDVDLFVYHQANSRILSAVAERLGLAPERVFDCIAELGNTSAASVPLALAEAARGGVLQPGARVVLAAVGAGLVVGRHGDDLGRGMSAPAQPAAGAAAERRGCALVTGGSRGIGAAIARRARRRRLAGGGQLPRGRGCGRGDGVARPRRRRPGDRGRAPT